MTTVDVEPVAPEISEESLAELDAETLEQRLGAEREALRTAHGEAYEEHLDRWGRYLEALTARTVIRRGETAGFHAELPGDWRAAHHARRAIDTWLSRLIENAFERAAFVQAAGELINNEYQHSLELGDPEDMTVQIANRRPKKSIGLAAIVHWADGRPGVEIVLETTGTIPPREVFERYFDIETENNRSASGKTELKLVPKPDDNPDRPSGVEDFVPGFSLEELDRLDADNPTALAKMIQDKITAGVSASGHGWQLIAGLLEKGHVELTYQPVTGQDPSKAPVAHQYRLAEQFEFAKEEGLRRAA